MRQSSPFPHHERDRTKSRLTFYYLLAQHFNKLDAFVT